MANIKVAAALAAGTLLLAGCASSLVNPGAPKATATAGVSKVCYYYNLGPDAEPQAHLRDYNADCPAVVGYLDTTLGGKWFMGGSIPGKDSLVCTVTPDSNNVSVGDKIQVWHNDGAVSWEQDDCTGLIKSGWHK